MRARSRLAAALVLLGSALAVAAPGRPAAATTHAAVPSTLHIVIDDIKPLAPAENSTLVVQGTLTNPGQTAVSSLTLGLDNVGSAVSRADLATFRSTPFAGGRQLLTKPVPKGLAAGASTPFTLDVPMIGEQLAVPSRVYKLTVVATGALTKAGPVAQLGLAGLPVPYFPPSTPIAGSLRTALVIPMTEVPDQGPVPLPGTGPPSKQLISDLSANGRLDRLLSVVEAAPPAGGIGGTRITLAIDPALLDRVCAMARRCKMNPAAGTTEADQQLASAWFSRLSAAVESPDVTVVGLPYADADIGAMSAAGATAAVVTLLKNAGGLVLDDLTSAATNDDLDPLLPVDGLADAGLGSAAVRAGSTVAVLSSRLFAAATPTADEPVTPSASTVLKTGAGTIPVLVTDPTLQDLLTTAADPTDTPRMQEQNLLAELAVINSEQPNDVSPQRTVVLEAPRDWDVSTDFSKHLVDALGAGAVSYVSSEGLETLQSARPILRPQVASPPQPDAPLPATTISTVESQRMVVEALHAVAAKPAETLSAPYGEGLDRALSAWWRGANAAAGAEELKSVTNDLTETMGKIGVRGGNHGVLLTGPSGTLPVQVSNLLSEPIAIVVHVKSDGLDQVTGHDQRVTLVPGTQLQQVNVPITTRSTRTVTVTMQLLAQSDLSEITAADISVRSSSVGKVAVGITATALTFLVLLIVFRGVRRVAARRRGEATA